MRANDASVGGLVSTNSSMTSLTNSSITTIGCGMRGRRKERYHGVFRFASAWKPMRASFFPGTYPKRRVQAKNVNIASQKSQVGIQPPPSTAVIICSTLAVFTKSRSPSSAMGSVDSKVLRK